MKLIFSENAWENYLYWQKTDKKVLSRINEEDHMVYKVTDDALLIVQLRYHY
ncbi:MULTISPECIES: type II toxin-antitoxin system YoeB family toxin [unclassified Marinobacter]|uniref:type II toxin-antitoxin system YoeB family toxin n=1 Tax=unclassified Marinobacter TaxID=83889 RepID=UPI000BF99128|nr:MULTISPECIES: type II toxin-antitoxin system YoeB family toxin [unclassified Marinobacter]PFG08710.1 toxin YoeB [Marinobacter sp. LV10MA510-1]PFG54542.1 toxin YoeB [Marinobacter sp. LV10R520-4]